MLEIPQAPIMAGSSHDSSPYYHYTMWLYGHVHPGGYNRHTYLMLYLNNKEFYWSIYNDSNRAHDGLDLRDKYNDLYPEDMIFDKMNCGCTVLEALVAMAMRAEDTLRDVNEGDQTYKWFWAMLDNLDIAICDDLNWKTDTVTYIDDILDIWLSRKFASDGRGSPWPVDNGNNMLDTEMWYQLQWWIADIMGEEDPE